MAFEEFKTKPSVVIVFTGDGKGKTSAALGLMARALGNRWKVAFIQFIKYWGVSEHIFIRDILAVYKSQLYFFKGGKGFYKAGKLSDAKISEEEHKSAAKLTYEECLRCAQSGNYNLVICDEINNAVRDGLISLKQMEELITKRHPDTSLCLTGRGFPKKLVNLADIVTDMTKVKHHYDENFLANKGIDF